MGCSISLGARKCNRRVSIVGLVWCHGKEFPHWSEDTIESSLPFVHMHCEARCSSYVPNKISCHSRWIAEVDENSAVRQKWRAMLLFVYDCLHLEKASYLHNMFMCNEFAVFWAELINSYFFSFLISSTISNITHSEVLQVPQHFEKLLLYVYACMYVYMCGSQRITFKVQFFFLPGGS